MSTVNGVGTTVTDQTSANKLSPSASSDINKNEFLNLLVAQLKNQDPMNPVDNQQFLAQLATFSSLEQLMSINAGIQKLTGESA